MDIMHSSFTLLINVTFAYVSKTVNLLFVRCMKSRTLAKNRAAEQHRLSDEKFQKFLVLVS
jgi:hypothetical protein